MNVALSRCVGLASPRPGNLINPIAERQGKVGPNIWCEEVAQDTGHHDGEGDAGRAKGELAERRVVVRGPEIVLHAPSI